MTAWRTGLGNDNVYATADSLRPLLGVYFYFGGADPEINAQRLRATRESFDFVQIEPRADQVDRCEEAGIPWMSVDQPAIPLGRDSPQWNSARRAILGRTREFADRFYLLGWNDGSEPHTSFEAPIRRLVHQWLNLQPGTIDAGPIKIVITDTTAAEPGIYCIENSSVLSLGTGLVGYEVVRQNPFRDRLCGPAVVRVWAANEPRIVDTDVCMAQSVVEQKNALSAVLVVPEFLRVSRPKTLTLYWPEGAPRITLDDVAHQPALLAPGFHRVSGLDPGQRTLRVEPAAGPH